MESARISICKEKLELNFVFYLFLKELNNTNSLTEKEINRIFNKCYPLKNNYETLIRVLEDEFLSYKNFEKKRIMLGVLGLIKNSLLLDVFFFSLKLIRIKSLLLEEAKLQQLINTEKDHGHYLSLQYDDYSKRKPYYNRVNGALLALLFFEHVEANKLNFLTSSSEYFFKNLSEQYSRLKKSGIEPNQIFMLMFAESINQSIKSEAGISYEERLKYVLLSIGIDVNRITKKHDKLDKSTEYDFFFELNGKKFGIGAKRTLRERYKQFIKTSLTSHVDVMIEVTLGIDLTEEKTKTIRKHGTYLFVADEIFAQKDFLQRIDGVFKGSDLTLDLLMKLSK